MAARAPRQAILISIDTLRADHLGCYGYPRATSPNIDRLARESLVFLNAFAPASYTHASFPSLFAGRYPGYTRTGFAVPYRFRYPTADATLMTALRADGIATAGFVSSIVLSHWYMDGLGDAFDHFDDELTAAELNRADMVIRRGDETVGRALAWLAGREAGDFFLWLHLIDVHGPYVPLPGAATAFDGDRHTALEPFLLPCTGPDYPLERADLDTAQLPSYQALPAAEGEGHERRADHYRARYDANIRYVDGVLGDLFARLGRLGVLDTAMVVIHSDHGEMLGEEAIYFYHGLTLHPAELRTPLIVRYPDRRTGASFGPVSLIDAAPTLLSHLGADCDDLGFQGRALVDAVPDYERTIYAQIPKQACIIRYPYQVVARRGTLDTFTHPQSRLCRQDCAAEPIEPVDAALLAQIGTLNHLGPFPSPTADSGIPAGAPAMLNDLAAYLDDADRERGRARPLVPSATPAEALLHQRLAALGYVE